MESTVDRLLQEMCVIDTDFESKIMTLNQRLIRPGGSLIPLCSAKCIITSNGSPPPTTITCLAQIGHPLSQFSNPSYSDSAVAKLTASGAYFMDPELGEITKTINGCSSSNQTKSEMKREVPVEEVANMEDEAKCPSCSIDITCDDQNQRLC